MWILMLLFMTDNELIMYDQGAFETADECIEMKLALESELRNTEYMVTCFKWKDGKEK